MKTILVDAVGTFVVDQEIYQPLFKLLQGYLNRKIILTNANDEQVVEFGLINLPHEMFSLKHNPDKTNPEYFKKMLENYSLKVEDVIYFEHSLEAVESAQSVGINSYHYNSENINNLAELKSFLDNNL